MSDTEYRELLVEARQLYDSYLTYPAGYGASGKYISMIGQFLKHEKQTQLQAKIDELMLEYCPEDMSPEQLMEYEKNQVPVDKLQALKEEKG